MNRNHIALTTAILACVASLLLPHSGAAQDATTLRGTVTAPDGTPHEVVSITAHAYGNAQVASTYARPDGSFELALDTTGVVELRIHPMHASRIHRFLYLRPEDPPVSLTARVAGFERMSQQPRVRGSFNGFASNTGTVAMTPQGDGTYAATVPSPGDTLRYQVGDVKRNDVVAGTQFDRVERRGARFVSVLASPGDSTRITLDLAAFPEPGSSSVTFDDPDHAAAAFARFYDETNALFTKMMTELSRRVEKDGGQNAYEWAGNYTWTENQALLDEALTSVTDPNLASAYRFVAAKSRFTIDSTLARRIVSSLQPDAAIWSLSGGSSATRILASTSSDEILESHLEYALRMLRTQPSNGVRGPLLASLTRQARESDDTRLYEVFYAWLESEFSGTDYVKYARIQREGQTVATPGTPMPDLSVPSLRDPSRTFSMDDFKGKVVLVDFWATWCAGCVDDVEKHQEVYEKYKDKGFDILSISLDASPSAVREFMDKHAMPWPVAHVEGGMEGELATRFQIYGLPTPILIGPDGTVIARGPGSKARTHLEELVRDALDLSDTTEEGL